MVVWAGARREIKEAVRWFENKSFPTVPAELGKKKKKKNQRLMVGTMESYKDR